MQFCKSPAIPPQVEHLPLQGYLSKKGAAFQEPTQVSTNDQGKFFKNSSHLADHNPSHRTLCKKNLDPLKSKYALSSARVAYCRVKERLLASKRLKNITTQGYASPKQHDVVPIKSSNEQDLSQNPYLQEWAKIKEERHFQIGRVIKYFID